jgi:hypothetical protein
MSGALLHQHWHIAIQAGLGPSSDGDIVFEHGGPMDHVDVERCIGLAEAFSLARQDHKGLRKRLVNVLVEALENLSKHVAEGDRVTTFARLERSVAGYRLVMGNALPIAVAAVLLNRVEILNEMDEADLKEHYLTLLKNDGRTASGGAGLGLVTLARKSGRSLKAMSYPINERQALLVMEVHVAHEEVR